MGTDLYHLNIYYSEIQITMVSDENSELYIYIKGIYMVAKLPRSI